MEFVLNYSTPSEEFFRQGILPIDRFKCPDWPDLVERVLPLHRVLVHFSFQAGNAASEKISLETAESLLNQTGTRFVNTHFAPLDNAHGEPKDAETVLREARADIERLASRFGRDRIVVENIPIYDNRSRLATRPENIAKLIRDAGVGLLLDIGHARIAARQWQVPEKDYFRALPLESLKEIHITGIGHRENGAFTDHMPMAESDWEFFAWALEQIRTKAWPEPSSIGCEYGGIGSVFEPMTDAEVIRAQIPKMTDMIRAARPED